MQKETGIPVYTRDFISDSDTKNILFSGIMTAIQSVMKEMQIGSMKKIQTEKYQIYGEEKEKFFLFLIGDITRPKFIDEFMDYIGGFLDFVPMADGLSLIPEEVETYLDESINHLLQIYNRSEFITGIFRFNDIEGLTQLTDTISKEVKFFLTNYFVNLESKNRVVDHIFYLITPDDDTLIGISKNYSSTLLINCMIFKENAISIFASYKQVFIKYCIEFLNKYSNDFLNPNSDLFEIELFAESLSSNIEKEFHQFTPTSEFIGANHLIAALKSNFITSISTLMLGKPIVILSSDKDVAKEIINLLVYISGISDASFDMDSDIPKRIVWSPREYLSLFKELNYAILDIDNNRLLDGISSGYLLSRWEEIFNLNENHIQQINSLRQECQSIWDKCDALILQKSKGSAAEILLKDIQKEQREIIEKILRWVNPSFVSSDLLIIDESKVNW
ncbi:MAG: hypothetical protein GPJ54_19430 [Candidatus Heimdallarchaeota archaeon]|nr:hypothetical protein [Candidatus Heimdallarchaeota archaeon]